MNKYSIELMVPKLIIVEAEDQFAADLVARSQAHIYGGTPTAVRLEEGEEKSPPASEKVRRLNLNQDEFKYCDNCDKLPF